MKNADFTFFLKYIKEGKIKTKTQITETIEFLKENPEYDYKDI